MFAILVGITLGPIYLAVVSGAPNDKATMGYDSVNSRDEVRVSSSGHVLPGADGHQDLGTPTLQWQDLHLTGTANIDTLNVDVSLGALPNGSITTPMILDDSVITSKILTDAVTTPKIQNASVTTAKLYLDLEVVRIVCVTTSLQLGYCNNVTAATGVCNNCVGP